MPRNTRSSARQSNAYPQHLTVELEPAPLSPISPLYTQQRMTLPPGGYYNMPSSSAAVPSSAGLGPPPSSLQEHAYEEQYLAPPVAMPHSHRPSSGAWSMEDDNRLMTLRAQGYNWTQIKSSFDNKTSNACRKRHERLVEKRDADDWDTRKFQRMAKEYLAMRKEIWGPLAARTGEKWQVVEQKCMSSGIKNLQTAARQGTRNERLSQSHAASGQALTGYDDDSGISGIGLTPELDAPYGSPDSGSAPSSDEQHYHHHHHHARSAAAAAAAAHHHRSSRLMQHPSHAVMPPQSNVPLQAISTANNGAYLSSFGLEPGYGMPQQQQQHRYSSSISSTASAGGHGGYNDNRSAGTSQGSTSPYMPDQRPATSTRRHR